MVRNLARFFMTAAIVLTLASCIFGMSVFPMNLTQVVARADLSAIVPGRLRLTVPAVHRDANGGEFVILIRRNSGIDPVVYVMDSDLTLIQSYSLAQLTAWYALYDGTAKFSMTNAEGNVEISNLAFSAGDLSTVGKSPSYPPNAPVGQQGFRTPNGQKEDFNFRVTGGSTLTYEQWNWFYAPFEFNSNPVQVSASGGNYQVVAVYDVDDTPTAGEVVLVLSDQNNSSNVYFVAIPLVDILTFGSVASPLFGSYPYRALNNLDASSIGFAVTQSWPTARIRTRCSATPPRLPSKSSAASRWGRATVSCDTPTR